MDNAKKNFALAVQQMATTLASLDHTIADLEKIYNARLYGPGADNEITDLELEQLEVAGGRKMTADQVYAFVILCSQFQSFLHNGLVSQADRSVTINYIRTDI